MQEDWNIILSVVESPDSSLIGQQKVFSTSPITVGRGDDNDFVISDPSISRNHSIIRITNDYTRVFITDMSTYGTEVGGKPVPKGPGSGFTLTDGDTIKLGNTTLRYELKLKLSVQSTFVGQQIDRSFLDEEKPPPGAAHEEDVKDAKPAPKITRKSQVGLNPVSITIIVVCVALLIYILFFA
ncbi:MAG: FHA domain-containing protein [Candidatus Latescibacteria bacterium]|nr:FHA domain-containing protein [Candidatus Latescibacterota bacterium]